MLEVPVIITTTAKEKFWGPAFPELLLALKRPYASIDRMTVNEWDDGCFVDAVRAAERYHLIFAGISLQICAALPAYSALEEGFESFVVVDASAPLNKAQKDVGMMRMAQQGVILTDYLTVAVEMMRSNAGPLSMAVYNPLGCL